MNIAQKFPSLIKNVLWAAVFGCLVFKAPLLLAMESGKILLPSGLVLSTQLAITIEEQQQGLSGVASKDFKSDQAMLFVYKQTGMRSFWMRDTYFNLDIIFLNKDLKVLAIAKNLPAHPGDKEPPPIHRTSPVWARHVLEVRADSPAAREIKTGMVLKWASKISLSQIISNTHRRR